MADQNITAEESLADQMLKVSSLATTCLQSFPIKDKNDEITLEENAVPSPQSLPVNNTCEDITSEKSLVDQMSKVTSLASTSLQSLYLPLLPPYFSHEELLLLLSRQRKVRI